MREFGRVEREIVSLNRNKGKCKDVDSLLMIALTCERAQ